jgi:hypothetical protein
MAWWGALGSLWGKGAGAAASGAATGAATSGVASAAPAAAGATSAASGAAGAAGKFSLGDLGQYAQVAQSMAGTGSKQGAGYVEGGSKDKTGDSILEPYRARRRRLTALMPMTQDIGSGIQPVASSRGGAAMVGAMGEERGKRMESETADRLSHLSKQLRDTAAKGNVTEQSVGLVKDLVMMYFTGGMGKGAMAGKGAMGGGAMKGMMG